MLVKGYCYLFFRKLYFAKYAEKIDISGILYYNVGIPLP